MNLRLCAVAALVFLAACVTASSAPESGREDSLVSHALELELRDPPMGITIPASANLTLDVRPEVLSHTEDTVTVLTDEITFSLAPDQGFYATLDGGFTWRGPGDPWDQLGFILNYRVTGTQTWKRIMVEDQQDYYWFDVGRDPRDGAILGRAYQRINYWSGDTTGTQSTLREGPLVPIFLEGGDQPLEFQLLVVPIYNFWEWDNKIYDGHLTFKAYSDDVWTF